MIIYAKIHPLKQRADELYFSAWRSVGALSASMARRYPNHNIYINGDLIEREHYGKILHETDDVMVCAIPEGGPVLVAFLVSLAVSAALTGIQVALTYLLRPKVPKPTGADRQSYGISGVGNQPDPFGAISKIYGRVRVFPKFPGKFPTQYTEIVGKDQFLRFLLLVGQGPLRLSEGQIGENPIDNYEDVEYQYLEGYPSDPPVKYYTRDVSEVTLNVALTHAADWQTQRTELNTDRISIDWSFLTGLQHLTKNGGRDALIVDVQIEYRLVGAATWTGFNQSKALNKTLMGYYPQQPISGPVLVKSDGPDTRTVTFNAINASGQAIVIAVVLNGTTLVASTTHGIKLIDATLSANDSDRLVSIYYYQQFAPQESAPEFPEPSYSDLVLIDILGSVFRTSGKTTSVVRMNHSWDVAQGQYDVQMRRHTADRSGQSDMDATTWTALRTIRNQQPINEPNCAIVDGRIRATNQLNGSIDNFSLKAESVLQPWDGSWLSPIVTRNPAWCVADILCGSDNPLVLREELNGESFLAFANWCDAEGYTFDYEFRTDDINFDAANMAAAAGRGSLDHVDGEYIIVIDQPQDVVKAVFNPRNVWDVEGSIVYPDEIHGLRVAFKNDFLNGQDDERIVYNDGYSASNATILDLVEYRGVIHPDSIYKFARYEIASRMLLFEQWSYSTSFERLRVTRGNLVVFAHDTILVGLGWGRVSSLRLGNGAYVASVKFDTSVMMAAGETYGVQIIKSYNGEVVEGQVVNTGGETRELTFLDPLLGVSVGDLVNFGKWGQVSQKVIIKKMESLEDEDGGLAARLTVQPYIPGIHTADTELIPAHSPIISIISLPQNLRPPEPSIRTIRSSEDTSVIQDNGSFAARMSVLVEFPSGVAVAPFFIQAQYRAWNTGGPWITTPTEDAQNLEIVISDVEVIVIYEVRIRAQNKLTPSLISPWSQPYNHAVLGDTIAPDPPTDCIGTPGDRMVTLNWLNPTNDALGTLIDFEATEIWQSLTNDSDDAVYVKESAGEAESVTNLLNGTAYYFWLAARDKAGNLSLFHDTQFNGMAVTPAPNVVLDTAQALLSSHTLQAVEDVLTLNYTSNGGRVRVQAKLWIDAATNDPSSVHSAQISLFRNSTILDSYTLSFQRFGPGYPGEINLVYEDVSAGAFVYKLAYAGSTPAARAVKISIDLEEVTT